MSLTILSIYMYILKEIVIFIKIKKMRVFLSKSDTKIMNG